MQKRSRFGTKAAMAAVAFLAMATPALFTGCGGGGGATSQGVPTSPPADPSASAGAPTAPSAAPSTGPVAGAPSATAPSASSPVPAGATPALPGATPAPAPAGAPAPAPATAPAPAPASASAPAATATGTIIPLYSLPGSGTWAAVAAAKQAHPSVPVLAVVNPNSGPGTAALSDYMAGIAQLVAAGVKVIGYVPTTYGQRPAADVQADIGRWRNLYPGATGVFFDEMASAPGQEAYYRSLGAYAKNQGMTVTIGNPGMDSQPSFVGTLDVIMVYEQSGVPAVGALAGWHTGYDRGNFGVIPYGVASLDTTFVAAAKTTCGYIYLQSDTLPNPWDTVPPYLDALLGALG